MKRKIHIIRDENKCVTGINVVEKLVDYPSPYETDSCSSSALPYVGQTVSHEPVDPATRRFRAGQCTGECVSSDEDQKS